MFIQITILLFVQITLSSSVTVLGPVNDFESFCEEGREPSWTGLLCEYEWLKPLSGFTPNVQEIRSCLVSVHRDYFLRLVRVMNL